MLENAPLRYIGEEDGTLTHVVIPIEEFINLRIALEATGIPMKPVPRSVSDLQTNALEGTPKL
jgi:hypothetical protein